MKQINAFLFSAALLTLPISVLAQQSILTIQNQVYGEAGENVYATIGLSQSGMRHETIDISEKNERTFHMPSSSPPWFISNIDVFYRNKPLSKDQHCSGSAYIPENGAVTLTITSDQNPVDAQSKISCHYSYS